MNINPKQLDALLKIAGKQLGTTPDELRKQLESGSFDNAIKQLPPQQQMMLSQALTDPTLAKKILSSPQAKEIYNKLSK